jgi:hypothetical protein
MPNLIDYLLEHDDVRHRIRKYIGYFMIIGGTLFTVGTVIFWQFFSDYR